MKFHITFTGMNEGVLTSVLQDQIKFQNNPGKQGSLLHPSQTEDSLKRQLQCWRDPSKGRNSTKEQEAHGNAVVTWQYWLVATKLQWKKATIAPSHTAPPHQPSAWEQLQEQAQDLKLCNISSPFPLSNCAYNNTGMEAPEAEDIFAMGDDRDELEPPFLLHLLRLVYGY